VLCILPIRELRALCEGKRKLRDVLSSLPYSKQHEVRIGFAIARLRPSLELELRRQGVEWATTRRALEMLDKLPSPTIEPRGLLAFLTSELIVTQIQPIVGPALDAAYETRQVSVLFKQVMRALSFKVRRHAVLDSNPCHSVPHTARPRMGGPSTKICGLDVCCSFPSTCSSCCHQMSPIWQRQLPTARSRQRLGD
jgi:hypothetical protein